MSDSEGENFDMDVSGSDSEGYTPVKKKVSNTSLGIVH